MDWSGCWIFTMLYLRIGRGYVSAAYFLYFEDATAVSGCGFGFSYTKTLPFSRSSVRKRQGITYKDGRPDWFGINPRNSIVAAAGHLAVKTPVRRNRPRQPEIRRRTPYPSKSPVPVIFSPSLRVKRLLSTSRVQVQEQTSATHRV
ncbi:hypothetical protein BJX61DRAFT_43033 [Aspergillus egyptiacus]|nr:hypothetical protein BJX61DRAFT_43033 [Aspergillus egyptiacus]